MRLARTAWLGAIGAAVLGLGVVPPLAHASEPTFSGPTVVLDNLAHPRCLKALADGVVLITESGREGTTPCLPDSPGSGRLPQCLSQTGRSRSSSARTRCPSSPAWPRSARRTGALPPARATSC